MKRPTPIEARHKACDADSVIYLLKTARDAAELLPNTRKKICSALKSAQGALRNAERFTGERN